MQHSAIAKSFGCRYPRRGAALLHCTSSCRKLPLLPCWTSERSAARTHPPRAVAGEHSPSSSQTRNTVQHSAIDGSGGHTCILLIVKQSPHVFHSSHTVWPLSGAALRIVKRSSDVLHSSRIVRPLSGAALSESARSACPSQPAAASAAADLVVGPGFPDELLAGRSLAYCLHSAPAACILHSGASSACLVGHISSA